MATAPLNIDTKRLPTTPQWSPILSHSSLSSPRSASTPDDLSLRCRKLARSFGEHSILEDAHFEPQSPSRSRENFQETSSSSSPLPPPASPLSRHSHHLPLSPPTPEGSHVLNEILEEENESTAATPNEELESEKGLGFENSQGGEAMQFKMSPCLGGQMSLHGASAALENDGQKEGGGGGLELSLHDQMKIDNEETFSSGGDADHEQVLKEELKNGKDWIKIEVSLVDDELLIGSPQSRLDPSRTFSTCYVDPLLRILSAAAPSSPAPLFSPHHRRFSSSSSLLSPSPSSTELTPSSTPTSSHPLHLHLTLHTPLQITLQYLLASLQPLHDEHYLVSYCSNARLTSKAPVMVLIEAGEVEGEEMDRELERLGNPRIIYREVKLDEISIGKVNDQSHPVVDIDYKTISLDAGELQREVQRLHEKGFFVKVGGLPRFPEHTRTPIELNLKESKVDYIA